MGKREFYNKLRAHDWYGYMSDDYRAVCQSEKDWYALMHEVDKNPLELKPILHKFREAHLAQAPFPSMEDCGIERAD